MAQISDEQLIIALARADREFTRARSLLTREDQPTPEQVEQEAPEGGSGKDAPDAQRGAEPDTQDGGDTERVDRDEGEGRGQVDQTAGDGDEESGGRSGLLGTAASVATSAASVATSAASTAGSVAATLARFGARQVTGRVHPRHEDWDGASVDERISWWVDRFGTGAAALAAVPSFGGRLTRYALGHLISAVGAAGQVLVVNAVGHELGGTDEAERVAVAAKVVLGRDLDIEQVRSQLAGAARHEPAPLEDEADEDRDDGVRPGVLRRLGSTALLVRRVAGQFRALGHLFDERPQGGLLVRFMRNLPAVGLLGGFLSERGGVGTAAREARAEFETRGQAPLPG